MGLFSDCLKPRSTENRLDMDINAHCPDSGKTRRIMDAKSKTQPPPSTAPQPRTRGRRQPALWYRPCFTSSSFAAVFPARCFAWHRSASSIGRSAENTFQLHDATVSRRHAVISIDTAGKAWIMDLGSTNGTFVDGEGVLLQTPIRIKDGSRIQLGSSTLLKYLKLDPLAQAIQHRELYERSVGEQPDRALQPGLLSRPDRTSCRDQLDVMSWAWP